MPDELLKSPIDCGVEVSLFGDDTIEFNGQKYVPDETKGYFRFALSHAFPVATAYGTALHATVIEKSYQSLLHQNINWEHQLRAYHKEPGEETSIQDRIIGGVVAVDFPRSPVTGWKLSANESPGIQGVGVLHKLTTGMAKIVGDHQTSRHTYTVSMEVQYPYSQTAFAVATGGKTALNSATPDVFSRGGYDIFHYKDAPEELLNTFSKKKNRIVGKYKGRDVFLLMGGIDNPVHYSGMGVVKYGAERTAKILRMAASSDLSMEPILSLPQLLREAVAHLILK